MNKRYLSVALPDSFVGPVSLSTKAINADKEQHNITTAKMADSSLFHLSAHNVYYVKLDECVSMKVNQRPQTIVPLHGVFYRLLAA